MDRCADLRKAGMRMPALVWAGDPAMCEYRERQELQALAFRASQDERNAKLARPERDAAAATRNAIALTRAIAPKP
jgi:hypothetical protein